MWLLSEYGLTYLALTLRDLGLDLAWNRELKDSSLKSHGELEETTLFGILHLIADDCIGKKQTVQLYQ